MVYEISRTRATSSAFFSHRPNVQFRGRKRLVPFVALKWHDLFSSKRRICNCESGPGADGERQSLDQ